MSGRVYSFGSRNDSGWLGVGDFDSRQIPTQLNFEGLDLSVDQIVQIRLGEKHALFLTKLGKVYVTGSNNVGQLGILRKECNKPVQILENVFDSPIRKIFTGPYQSFFISEKLTVYACGNNSIEQLFLIDNSDFKETYQVYSPISINHSLRTPFHCGCAPISVDEIVGGETRSFLFQHRKKVVISNSNETISEFRYERPKHEPCYVDISDQLLSENVKKIILPKRDIISLHNNGECFVSGAGTLLGLSAREQVLPFEKVQLKDEYHIEDVCCGPYHVILKTLNRKLYSFGSNRFGELGIGLKNISFRELQQPMSLPFEWKEGEDVKMYCGNNYTLLIHEQPLASTQELIATNIVMYLDGNRDRNQYFHVENSDIYVFLPLVEKISKDLHSLLTNRYITERLVREELDLLYKICKFICCELSLTTEDEYESYSEEGESYHDDLFIRFDRFLSELSEETIEKDLITCLFFLNDISDVGIYFKSYLFNEASKRITVDNVMDLLLETSNYLAWKLLKNSENSIMLLFIRKCFAFIKTNAEQCNDIYGSSELFLKIKPKVEQTKASFFGIQVQWKEENIAYNLEKSLNFLFEDPSNSNLNVIYSSKKQEILKLHKCILAVNSPVLSIMLSEMEESTIDLLDFSLMMSDSLNEMFFENCKKTRSEILKIVLEMCYGKFDNDYELNELICILFISHQFQMEYIVKYCCRQLIKKMSNDKRNINLFFYLASVLEVDSLCKEFVETFIIHCSRILTPEDLLDILKIYSNENFTPSFVQRVRLLQDLIYKKNVEK